MTAAGHRLFISAREAELANYGSWTVAYAQRECDRCGYVIMIGDKVRVSDSGGYVCVTCGEE